MVVIASGVGVVPVAQVRAWTRGLVRFAVVGVVNTGLFLVLYLVLRMALPAVVASVVATGVTTVTGTVVNGRVTFGVGAVGVVGHLKSLVVTGLGVGVTSGAVGLVGGGAADEVVVLVVASAVVGLLRFVLMGCWVFRAV
ncbi:GtrA family protein [Umezawaea tangerina]|uniref:GtrA-like protein n=1 Tax=Umezawaea tangerina TaxID=84725 RepID=A0A2T0THD4_9PSEU|nr:GtrA family protein [Umezawaea tangerina]PRY45029.1 GtrA-like protein [Umezawaea tangerina]